MRLVKLYAKYMSAMEEKPKEPKVRDSLPGEEFEDEDMTAMGQRGSLNSKSAADLGVPRVSAVVVTTPAQTETRVGKKLGDMTTRRVIILVLVMLFCMPQFNPDSHGLEEFGTSMDIGMEIAYERLRA